MKTYLFQWECTDCGKAGRCELSKYAYPDHARVSKKCINRDKLRLFTIDKKEK